MELVARQGALTAYVRVSCMCHEHAKKRCERWHKKQKERYFAVCRYVIQPPSNQKHPSHLDFGQDVSCVCEDSREALPKCGGDWHYTLPGAGRVHLEAVSLHDTSTCISMPPQGSTGWSTSRGGWPDEREIPGHGCSQYGAGDSEFSITTFANSFDLLKQMSCMKFAQDLCES